MLLELTDRIEKDFVVTAPDENITNDLMHVIPPRRRVEASCRPSVTGDHAWVCFRIRCARFVQEHSTPLAHGNRPEHIQSRIRRETRIIGTKADPWTEK